MSLITDLKIEKLVYKGYGLGFSGSHPVFVTKAVPEDIIDARVLYKKGSSFFAAIDKLKKPSRCRRQPDCNVFGLCGGCDWLNIDYKYQLKFKQQIIEEIFYNLPISQKLPIIESDEIDFYRNKAFFPISTRDGLPVAGMFANKTHEVIPHEKCRLQPELFDQVIRVFLDYARASRISVYDEKTGKGSARHLGIRYSANTNELLVILVSKTRKIPFSNQLIRVLQQNFSQLTGVVLNINPQPTNVILGNDQKLLLGRDYIYETLGGMEFKLNYRSFFQVNSKVAGRMYEFIRHQVQDSKVILDAYCGVGSIGIFISGGNKRIIGIENNPNAVQDAVQNAAENGLENCDFSLGNVEDSFSEICRREKIDTIIFDPPRKGLNRAIIDSMPASIRRIVYISCNPVTQMRDVKYLLLKGFKAHIGQPFDMFPHTFHIENVIVLIREI